MTAVSTLRYVSPLGTFAGDEVIDRSRFEAARVFV
jgi:hypothetical protein